MAARLRSLRENLTVLSKEYGVEAGTRGNVILLRGPRGAVAAAERAILEVLSVLGDGKLRGGEVARSLRTLRQHPDLKLSDLVNDVVLATPRKTITAKGVTQQMYVNAIRNYDVVFGIGPAGTGKTYLAMAMAVRALTEKRVKKIVLTRPAVEAGEKLGFLPGDLAEKVNPYLRPLYDALHDMMDVERADGLVEREIVEVAPLAFMRGRTLNDSFVILEKCEGPRRASALAARDASRRLGAGVAPRRTLRPLGIPPCSTAIAERFFQRWNTPPATSKATIGLTA